MEEIWKPVVGYEGLYEVSNLGRVKRVARQWVNDSGIKGRVTEMIMKEIELYSVVLHKDGKYKNRHIRSLVAEAFLGSPYGTNISHLDRNFSNNHLDNIVSTDKFRTLDPDWRDIPDWEGEYQASRFGEIRSLDRYVKVRGGGYRFFPGVVRAMDENEDGYYQICLYRNGKAVITTNAHIFVAKAWIPNPENKLTVNHIDGNKHNNCIENLEWATYKENNDHAFRTGLRKHHYWDCSIHGPVGGDWNEKRQVRVRCIETGQEFPSLSSAAEAFNTGASEIKMSVDDHRIAQGYHFVKADEPDYEFGVKSLEGEVWKDIPGYEGRYKISNMQRVKSVERRVKSSRGFRTVPEKLINVNYGLILVDEVGHTTNHNFKSVYNSIFNDNTKLFDIG